MPLRFGDKLSSFLNLFKLIVAPPGPFRVPISVVVLGSDLFSGHCDPYLHGWLSGYFLGVLQFPPLSSISKCKSPLDRSIFLLNKPTWFFHSRGKRVIGKPLTLFEETLVEEICLCINLGKTFFFLIGESGQTDEILTR